MKTQLRILKTAVLVALALWLQGLTPARAQSPLADSFNPGADGDVLALAVQTDGKILVGGQFSVLGGAPHAHLGRLNSDGTLDPGFNPGADGNINCVVVQPDGKILVGGAFTTLAGQNVPSIGRLNSDGTLDLNFHPGANGSVFALALQPDGKIVVGGSFAMLGGQSRSNLARLNGDGTLDLGFNPGADSFVYSLALQVDGQILAGGNFTVLGGQNCQSLGRLDSSGKLDPRFNAGLGGTNDPTPEVYSLALQADGNILVGGDFLGLGGASVAYLGRLHSNGMLDTTFSAGANNSVTSLGMQADGKILVAGPFNRVGDQDNNSLARLTSTGGSDPNFNPDATAIECLALQLDGKILVGGYFGNLGGQSRARIGRLNATDPAVQSLALAGSTLTWTRQGTVPEVLGTTFDYSLDSTSWTNLGLGTRISGGWQLTGITVPTNLIFRARGPVAGGYNGSGWFMETLLYQSPLISGAGLSANGQLRFDMTGSPGQIVIIETSSNLTGWMPIRSNILTTVPVQFTDFQTIGLSNRFYRLRVGP